MPIIQRKISEWKDKGYLDEKIMTVSYQRKGRKLTCEAMGYRLNLEPMYEYFKNKGIEFSEEERSFVFQMLGQENLSYIILKEFPDEDIIQACIKFYIKTYILFYANSPSAESRIKMRDKIIKNTKKLQVNKKNSKKNKEITNEVWNFKKNKDSRSFEDNITNPLIIHKLVGKWKPKFCDDVDGKFIKAHFGDVKLS